MYNINIYTNIYIIHITYRSMYTIYIYIYIHAQDCIFHQLGESHAE